MIEPVDVPTPPVNTYELVVTGMSGDGDHEEENWVRGDHDYIIRYVKLLNAVCALDWNTRCDEAPIYPVLKAKGAELGFKPIEAEYWYDDMVGPDITCEDRRAMLVGVDVFWYDATGKKFEVEVKGLINPR